MTLRFDGRLFHKSLHLSSYILKYYNRAERIQPVLSCVNVSLSKANRPHALKESHCVCVCVSAKTLDKNKRPPSLFAQQSAVTAHISPASFKLLALTFYTLRVCSTERLSHYATLHTSSYFAAVEHEKRQTPRTRTAQQRRMNHNV